MNRYRIVESVRNHRLEAVHSYDDLEIHHPSANALGLRTGRPSDFQKGRHHERVEGRFEEVHPTSDGRVLVKKDFILSQDGAGPVYVPSPVAGYVHYLHDRTEAVRVYDRPYSEPGARLLAQSLHMDPRTFGIPEGHRVAYGEPLGVMSDRGIPNSIHAHVEVEVDRFRRYVRDIDEGTIAPGRWPARGENAIREPRGDRPDVASTATSELHPGHPNPSRSARAAPGFGDVIALQHSLNQVGARDERGLPLAEDGVMGRHTREAIKGFQRDHGLPEVGHMGPRTREALHASHGPRVSDHHHPDYPLFEKTLGLVAAAEARQGIATGAHTENIAAALVVQMRREGMRGIDRVDLGQPPRFVRAVQVLPGASGQGEYASMPIETRAASRQSLHASSDLLAQLASPSMADVALAQGDVPVPSKPLAHSVSR